MEREKQLTFIGKDSKEFEEALSRTIKFITKKHYKGSFVHCYIGITDINYVKHELTNHGYSKDGIKNIVEMLDRSTGLFKDDSRRFYVPASIKIDR